MAVPNAPSELRYEIVNTRTVNVYWRDNAADELRYKAKYVIWQTGAGAPPGLHGYNRIFTLPPNSTFFQFTQLFPNTVYIFSVWAENADGASLVASSGFVFTPILPLDTPPAAPTNLEVIAISDRYVDIKFQVLADNADGHEVEISLDGSDYTLHGTTQNPVQFPEYRVGGLTASTPYWVRVRAYNIRGKSAYSNVVTATTSAYIGIPGAPTNLMVVRITHNAALLRFTDTASNEEKFNLQVSDDGGSSWGNVDFLDINETEYEHTSLTSATDYQWRVRAENIAGDSDWSNVAGATTLATPTIPAAPSNLLLVSVRLFAATVDWTDNSDNESRFHVEVSTDGGAFVDWDPQTISLGPNTESFVIGGLQTNAHTYQFRVRAENEAGFSDYSNTVSTTLVSTYQSYLTDPLVTDNKAYIITPAETGSYILTGPVGEVGSTARWAFLTDGIRANHQIPPTTDTLSVPNEGSWKAANDILSAVIEAEQDTTVAIPTITRYTLTLNTFDNTVYTNDEVDLFLCAVSPLPDVTVNEPGLIPFAQQQPLSAMSNLRLGWTQGVVAARQGNRNASGVDVAIAFISVYFKNTVTDQTLQYQIYTFDSRGFQFDGHWFNSTGPFFGVIDSIQEYGGSYLGIGQVAQTFLVQILARVASLMSSCPNPAFDDDLANWKITLLSAGPFTNGEASITSTIERLTLEARLTETDPSDGVSITSISPRTGVLAGGTTVNIVGVGFVPGATVTIGGVTATSVTWVRETLITAVTGAHAAGVVDVVVTLPSSQSATLVGGFTYTDDPGTGECEIPDGTVCWQVAGPLVTVGSNSFVTAATVTTVIDTQWEFTAATAGTQLVKNSQVQVPVWQARHKYWPGDSVRPTDPENHMRAVASGVVWDEKKKTGDVPSGTSGDTEPSWPEEAGARIEDNEVEWSMVKDQWYKDGVLRFTSGYNSILAKQFEVLLYDVSEDKTSARFRLVFPAPYPIQVGDTFLVEAGCDKTHMTCIYKFNNILNFGGEPYVAGFNRPHDTPTDENLQS